MAHFKEYNTSDTVTEFVARREEFPVGLMLVLLCTVVVFIICPSVQVPAAIIGLFVFNSLWNTVVEESITVIKEFGIQIKAKYLFNTSEDVLFLDHDKIDGQLLQECITGSAVRYHLSFIVSGEKSLTVAFKHVYPGLPALQSVCKALSPPSTEGTRSTRQHQS